MLAALCAQSHDRAALRGRRRSSRSRGSLGVERGRDPQRSRRQCDPRRHAGRRRCERSPTQAGVTILSINALQRFNEWTAEREREATELADYAEACGAEALVLVPVNDGIGPRQWRAPRQSARRADGAAGRSCRRAASPAWSSRSASRSARCAPSRKRPTRFARSAAAETFRLVHDTFHHHLPARRRCFPR